jgi:hypothetical protein
MGPESETGSRSPSGSYLEMGGVCLAPRRFAEGRVGIGVSACPQYGTQLRRKYYGACRYVLWSHPLTGCNFAFDVGAFWTVGGLNAQIYHSHHGPLHMRRLLRRGLGRKGQHRRTALSVGDPGDLRRCGRRFLLVANRPIRVLQHMRTSQRLLRCHMRRRR